MRRIISLVLSFAILFSAFTVSAANTWNLSKISEELKIHMKDENEKIPVYIWFKDLDIETINDSVYKTIGYSQIDLDLMDSRLPKYTGADDDATAFLAYKNEVKDAEKEIQKMQNHLISESRKAVKEAYLDYNYNNLKALNLDNGSIIYVSKFSPVIIANITRVEISDLERNDSVIELEYKDPRPPIDETTYALSTIDGKYVRDTQGYNGEDVKVGIYDGGKIKKVNALNNTTFSNLNSSVSYSSHATTIANIIAGKNGFAPRAKLYCNSNTTSAEAGIEALIEKDVSVINVSSGWARTSGVYYTGFEKWFDHIASQHGITIVKSAGNDGTSAVVSNPGLAFNIITVGSTHTNLTTSKTDDYFCTYTSTANGGTSGCAKPDILAPGEYSDTYNNSWNIASGGGTSFAAPAVAGVIAQMIECKPTIASKPVVIKAVLTASTMRKLATTSDGTVAETWAGNITAQQGAGEINAKKAILILAKGNYATGNISDTTITKSFSVTSGDLYIRYGVSWLRKSTAATDHTNTSATVTSHANLRLKLYNPSNNLLSTSNVTNSSVELGHISIKNVYGTYKAKIDRVDSNTNSVKYAIAWR